MKKIPTGLFKRGTKMMATASKLGAYELTKSLSKNPDSITFNQVEALVKMMGELKGAAMKVGQLLSLEAMDILPSELTDLFAKLQQDAPPIEFKTMKEVLEKEWGKKLELIPIDVSPVTLASASIGQVHRAVYQKKALALKIQYPHIDLTIKNDLALIKNLLVQFLFITGKKVDLKSFFDEIESTLILETDYTQELLSLKKYKTALEGHPLFKVPDFYPELCTSKVLAMSFEAGLPLKKWLDLNHEVEAKLRLGKGILDLYLWEFLSLGLVQTDPNFSNYLIQGEASKIVLLDFGSCKEYNKDFIKIYQQILKATYDRRDEDLLKYSYEFELLSPKEDQKSKDLFIQMMQTIIEPFRHKEKIFKFAHSDYAKATREIGWTFGRSLNHSTPPKNLLFLHRKLGGIFSLLRRLEIEMELGSYWEKMVE
jgi:predicted unusual protein kinase regulating ubiquinone biosynthesis (AarF/ABC1/UbiB family)